MKTIGLMIPNMKSSHCQLTVTQAVEAAGGSIRSIAPTRAEIELRDGLTANAVIHAIQDAGYKVTNQVL